MELPSKPDHLHNLEFVRILTPYVFIKDITKNKSVLDIGSGSGHGTWLMAAEGARSVSSLDCDRDKSQKIQKMCANVNNCYATAMDAQAIGFKDGSFQVVTCFEVIEHIENPRILISEVRRILRRDGFLILTTPNRAMRLLPLQSPWNREHFREYRRQSLRRHLQEEFPWCEVLGVYGNPVFHNYYRRMWKQNPFRVYFSKIRGMVRMLIPSSIRRWIMTCFDYGTVDIGASPPGIVNTPIPVPEQEMWPFYIGEVNNKCLNYLVICGFDRQIIRDVANKIVRSIYSNKKECSV